MVFSLIIIYFANMQFKVIVKFNLTKVKVKFWLVIFTILLNLQYGFATKDAGVTALLTPKGYLCESENFQIKIRLKNFGTEMLSNIPIQVAMGGILPNVYNIVFIDSLAPNTDTTMFVANVNPTGSGYFFFKAYTQLGLDINSANDSSIKTTYVSSLPANLDFNYLHSCGPDSFIITPPPLINAYYWYTSDTATYPVFVGDSFYTPLLTNSTTYWITPKSYNMAKIGALDNSFGNTNSTIFYADAIIFNVIEAVVLDTFFVYTVNTGQVIVRIKNFNNLVLKEDTFNITTSGIKTPLKIGYLFLPGNSYKIDAVGTNTGLIRNINNATYPYGIDDVIQITGNTLNPSYYFYFYDWRIRFAGCSGNRVPVDVRIYNGPPTTTFTHTTNGLAVSFVNTTLDADSFIWDFGQGPRSLLTTPVNVYTLPGTYQVMLITFNDCGSDTAFLAITVNSIGINNSHEANMFIAPNPSNGIVYFNSMALDISNISIFNKYGQLILDQSMESSVNFKIDISNWNNGIYWVAVFNNKGQRQISKLVKVL
jgi:PKD repeat protein